MQKNQNDVARAISNILFVIAAAMVLVNVAHYSGSVALFWTIAWVMFTGKLAVAVIDHLTLHAPGYLHQ